MKYLGDKIIISFENIDLFKKFKAQWWRTKLPFHTYSTDQNRILVVILKGLPKFESWEIIQELQAQHLQALSCLEIQRNPNSKYPI